MAATLLLADDSITIQRVIELTFADEDIRVLVAVDGQQAIQKIDSEHPDIVLADIGMPRVDGYAVATHVKQSASLKHIPVLLLTGAFEPIDEARARKTGCDGVLVKPFEPQKLVARVKELLAGARGAELWPADMPRTQVAHVTPAASELPELLRADQNEVATPPLSVPAPIVFEELDPVIAPVVDAVFDLGEVVSQSAEPPAALEGEDVAIRNGEQGYRQSRPELPPPVDRLETELDMLDAALSRLDPTARPQELDEETKSDFARDLNELRHEAREEDLQAPRPPRPSFGTWDLPDALDDGLRVSRPVDLVVEEIPLAVRAAEIPAPIVVEPPPAPIVHVRPSAPVVHVPPPPAAPPAPVVQIAPPPPPRVVDVPPPAPVVHVPPPPPPPAPVVYVPPPAPVAPPPPPPIERPTLAAAFSALLAAEKSHPAALAAAPQISEAAIEEVVKRVLARMAGDTVNRVVLETAERMIRDEISRTKDPSGR